MPILNMMQATLRLDGTGAAMPMLGSGKLDLKRLVDMAIELACKR